MKKFIFLVLFFWFPWGQTQPQENQPPYESGVSGRVSLEKKPPTLRKKEGRYLRKFYTVAHQVLDMESQAQAVPDACYQVLDSILLEASRTIRVTDVSQKEQALQALQQIENILVSHNFVSAIPIFLVDTFTEAVTARQLVPAVLDTQENERRKKYIEAHRSEMFYHADCDTFSLIYLAVGELLHLPIQMVDVPQHAFIRWHWNKNAYINWETNFGYSKYDDEQYRQGVILASNPYNLSLESIVSGAYLKSRTRQEVVGYFLSLRGNMFARRFEYTRSLDDHLNAYAYAPNSPYVLHNLAWTIVNLPGMQYYHLEPQALALALRVATTHPDPAHLHTLALAYAANGKFSLAMEAEKRAYDLTKELKYSHMMKVFEQQKTYLQHTENKLTLLKHIQDAPNRELSDNTLKSLGIFSEKELSLLLEGLTLDQKITTKQAQGQAIYCSKN